LCVNQFFHFPFFLVYYQWLSLTSFGLTIDFISLCRVPATAHVRVLREELFRSPPRSFDLPVYISGMAIQQVEAHSPLISSTPAYDRGVLQYIDRKARQGEDSDTSTSSSQ